MTLIQNDWWSLLSDPASVREVEPGLHSVLPNQVEAARYDRIAAAYDVIVGLPAYHRIFWGTPMSAYTGFGAQAVEAARDGHFAEAGCGSLLFTASLYRDRRGGCTVLMDRSLHMLRRAYRSLASDAGARRADLGVLQADIASMPIRAGVFSGILCLNVLHVPCDIDAIASEFARTLVPGRGLLFVSSLVRSGRWSDAYMAALHRAGELSRPRTVDELSERVTGKWGVVESSRVRGNMCFLVVRHAGRE